jgi:Glycosyl transferase family 2
MGHMQSTTSSATLLGERSAKPSSWRSVVHAYRAAYLGHRDIQADDLAIEFSGATFDHICAEVQRQTFNSARGDVLLLDLRLDRGEYARARQRVADILFRSGYEAPVIWGSHDILRQESQRSPLVNWIIPARAYGFPPDFGLPNIARIRSEKGRVLAIAVRSALALPKTRSWKISVVLPAFNEVETIDAVIEKILSKDLEGAEIELLIVESNSNDGTRERVLAYEGNPNTKVILEDRPRGKGHAVRTGLRHATGDIVLIQDADLEYDIEDYDKLIEPIKKFQTSFVLGSRHTAEESAWNVRSFDGQQHLAKVMNFGHIFFTWLLNVTFRQRLRDPFTMFKVFRRDAIENVSFECNRFDFDIELVGKLIRVGRLPIEIDIKYESRSFEEGKKVSFFRDPPTWVAACAKHRFSQFYTFADRSSE